MVRYSVSERERAREGERSEWLRKYVLKNIKFYFKQFKLKQWDL